MFQMQNSITASVALALALTMGWSESADAQVSVQFGTPYNSVQSYRSGYVQPGYSTYPQPSSYGQVYSYNQPYSYRSVPQRYGSGYRGTTGVYNVPSNGSYYGSSYQAIPNQSYYGSQPYYGNQPYSGTQSYYGGQPYYGNGLSRSQAQGAAVGGAIGGAVGGQRGAAIGSIIGAASQE